MKFADLFKTTQAPVENYQETEIFTESNKVMKILLDQEKEILNSLTPYEELKLVQQRLRKGSREERSLLFDREEELEKMIRIEDYPILEIPDHLKAVVADNYDREMKTAEEMEAVRIKRIKAIREEIENLKAEEKELTMDLNHLAGNKNYVKLVKDVLSGEKIMIYFHKDVFGNSKWSPIAFHIYKAMINAYPSERKFKKLGGNK